MATTAPTFSQIRAQVAAIRRKLPEAQRDWYSHRGVGLVRG